MKIGLIRHFKVRHPFPKKFFLAKPDVLKWFEEYDSAPLEYGEVKLWNETWQKCYASPLLRAQATARHIYRGDIALADELKELNILHLMPNWPRFPLVFWAMLVRIKYYSNHRDIAEFRQRLSRFIAKIIEKDENVIIVSHWFVMKVLEKELSLRQFSGDKIKSGAYGKIFVFNSAKMNSSVYSKKVRITSGSRRSPT